MILLQCALPLLAGAQTLTLDECRRLAHDNYPAVKQYGLIEQSRDFTVSNAAKGWLPQVSAQGGGYAFTDVLKSSAQMQAMGIDIKKQLLSGSLTVTQPLYDGGQISAQKHLAEAEAEVDKSQLGVTLYDLNQRIEQLYFGTLLYDEQLAQNRLLQSDLAISHGSVAAMMKGGIANQTDLDAVSVEEVKARQQQASLQAQRRAYLSVLGIFIGRQLGEQTQLQRPPLVDAAGWTAAGVQRPELDYYTAQTRLLDVRQQQLDARLRPTVSAFGMGMLHSQVTDMAKNGMLLGGLTVSWNIGALYTRKNDMKKLQTQRLLIDTQRETFLFNNRLQNESAGGNVESLRTLIGQDDEIVSLRERIRSKSEKKVQLGTESVNEMLRDINAVSEARQQKALHEIQLLQALYQIKNLNNH
jgi:outer membrane protein TolC